MSSTTHCIGCGLHLSEVCQPGCPERDGYYASAQNAVQNVRQRKSTPRSRATSSNSMNFIAPMFPRGTRTHRGF